MQQWEYATLYVVFDGKNYSDMRFSVAGAKGWLEQSRMPYVQMPRIMSWAGLNGWGARWPWITPAGNGQILTWYFKRPYQ